MPDNAIFSYAAYVAAAVVYGGYVVSLVVRRRRANERLDRQDRSGVAPQR